MQYFLSHRFKEGDCNFHQINVGEQLGNGNSIVFSIIFQNKPAAMKQIIIKNQEQAKRVENQIMIMKTLSQYNYSIIKYYGSFTTIRQLDRYNMTEMTYIVMEKAVMSLERLIQHKIKSEEMFNETEILSIMKILINTLYILQKQGIAHCDIKPENILVMNIETLEVKLCDIGSCRITVETTEEATLVGTVPFLAPELVKNYSKEKVTNNPYKSDVFSLGLCFIYLLLFKKFKSNERLKITEDVYREIVEEWIIEAKELYFRNQIICMLLDELLNFDQKTRVNFVELNDIFNKGSLEYSMKNTKIIKQAKRKQEQLFVQKVKTPARSTYYSVRQQPKFATTSDILRKTNSFAIKLTSTVSSTQSPNSSKFRRKIIITKKSQERSTPNLSNINVAISPLLSKRKKSINTAMFLQTNYISSTTDDSPKLVPKVVQKQKSQFILDIQKHRICYLNSDTMEQIKLFEIKWTDKLVIFDGCYTSICDPKQLTLRINTEENMSLIMMSLKEQQNLNSLVVDLISFVLPSESVLQSYTYFESIQTLSLLMDNSQISNFNKFLLLWIPHQIKKLNISLKRARITSDNIYEMILWISSLLQLQFLNLNLQELKINEKQNQQIIEIISKSKKLKHLKINFSNNNISYVKEHPWQFPKHLQKLVLEYSYNNLRSVLNNISISLSGIKTTLRQLVLKLEDTALSSKQVNFLFNCLTKLQLDTLCLKLGHNHLDDSASKYISKNLPLLQTITHLDIGLENTNITSQGFGLIVTAIDKIISKKIKFVTLSYHRYTDKQTIVEQTLGLIKSECKTHLTFDNSIFRFYMIMKPTLSQIRTSRKVNFKKSVDTFCQNYHKTGESFRHYSCLTCIEKNSVNKNICLCEFCSQSCDVNHHTIVPTYENVNCGCTYLKCKSDINQQFCSKKDGYVIQKEFKCLLCQKNNLCSSCSMVCKKNHLQMVVENQYTGKFKCCQNKDVI